MNIFKRFSSWFKDRKKKVDDDLDVWLNSDDTQGTNEKKTLRDFFKPKKKYPVSVNNPGDDPILIKYSYKNKKSLKSLSLAKEKDNEE